MKRTSMPGRTTSGDAITSLGRAAEADAIVLPMMQLRGVGGAMRMLLVGLIACGQVSDRPVPVDAAEPDATVPTDTDALASLPFGDQFTQFIDDADDFVSWDAWILYAWPQALFCEHVTVADAAGLHLDADLSHTWLRNRALDDLKICTRLRNLRHFHWCYGNSCS